VAAAEENLFDLMKFLHPARSAGRGQPDLRAQGVTYTYGLCVTLAPPGSCTNTMYP
jgi:hypothetical protein